MLSEPVEVRKNFVVFSSSSQCEMRRRTGRLGQVAEPFPVDMVGAGFRDCVPDQDLVAVRPEAGGTNNYHHPERFFEDEEDPTNP